jgi:FMN phosphatase YigB (HAD superfamily)
MNDYSAVTVPAPSALEGIGAIIFDLDGTLYNSKKIALRLVAAYPPDALLNLAERLLRRYFAGRDYGSAEAYYAAFFAKFSRIFCRRPAFSRSWYFETYLPRMIRALEKFYPCRPGTPELFESLRTGNNKLQKKIPFAIYSDYPRTADRLRAIGIETEPGEYYGPEDFGAPKPAPRPFLSIAAALSCATVEGAAANVLVVGDKDKTDRAGAAAAGMRYIGISNDAEWEEFCALLIEVNGKGAGR